MLFMNEDRIYGRTFRDEAGDGGEGGGGSAGEGGDGAEGGDGGADNSGQLSELQQQLEAMQSDNQRLQAKIGEANKHKKEAEKQAAAEARAKAEAEGNFQQLFESSEKERASLADQLSDLQGNIANEKRNSMALDIANDLAASPKHAKLLAKEIAPRLKFVEGSIKVVDNDGNLTVSTPKDLKKEVSSSAEYDFLLKGQQSSGGGATGGSSSGGAAQAITRSEFDALSPSQKVEFGRKGGKATDS